MLVLCQVFLVQGAYAQAVDAEAYKNVKPYYAPVADLLAVKGIVDDPTPFYTDTNFYKKFIPDDVWPLLTLTKRRAGRPGRNVWASSPRISRARSRLRSSPASTPWRTRRSTPSRNSCWKRSTMRGTSREPRDSHTMRHSSRKSRSSPPSRSGGRSPWARRAWNTWDKPSRTSRGTSFPRPTKRGFPFPGPRESTWVFNSCTTG